MWFIAHVSSGETLCFLPQKLKYTVGRANADLELEEDICISRAHAIFHLINNKGILHMELEDVGSKYGTFYNNDIEKNTPLEKGHKIILKENDLIRFGRLQNVWKVYCMSINTVKSSLNQVDAQQVETYVKAIGGTIQDQWCSSSTHLTMKDPSVTMKLLHALVDQKLIVTPDYWKELLNSVSKHKSRLPNPELYSPRFDDDDIDVSSKPERRFLLKGTTFVFLNRKHFDMYSPIVKAAGGACKDLNSGVQKSFMIKNEVVVVQYTPSTQTQSTQTINTIAEYLESHSKRIIPEYEIGLAILHCSIEKYCNPSFKQTQTLSLTVPNESLVVDQDSFPNNDTQTLDLEIPETNEYLETNTNLVTSTPYCEPPNINRKISNERESMSDMCITETPAEDNQRKRKLNKVMTVDLEESDDEDLFQFTSKKQCQTKEVNEEIKHKSIQREKSKSTPRNHLEEDNPLNSKEKPSTSKAKLSKNFIFSNFLEKSQKHNKKSQLPLNESEKCSSDTRKRPRIQVLDENDEGDDDEDLFSFGDTQKNKKSRENPTKDNEDDLFGFKDNETSKNKEQTKTIQVEDEDSNDLVPTQQFIVTEKSSKSRSIQMLKPKIIPRKVLAMDWLTGSLCKIKINNENSCIKDEEYVIKTESTTKNANDLNISEDHRKWLESLNGAIEIQQVSLNNTIKLNEKSLYKFKNRSNDNTSKNSDGTTITNFKTFVKKYYVSSPQNTSIIKLHLR